MSSAVALLPVRAFPLRSAAWGAALALVVATGALAAGTVTGHDARGALRVLALALAALAAVEDLRTRRIRNVLSAPALVLALSGAHLLTAAVLGALLAPLPFLAIAWWRPGAMGMGDVKLAAVAGALVGLVAVPSWWFATSLAGAALALVALVRGGKRATLAYGPALVAGLGVALW
jgi:leader peptidase (prepilin peptidase)/N-methyltransferase